MDRLLMIPPKEIYVTALEDIETRETFLDGIGDDQQLLYGIFTRENSRQRRSRIRRTAVKQVLCILYFNQIRGRAAEQSQHGI